MMSVPETCAEIKAHGITASHIYPLDPDGKGRNDWVLVISHFY